MTTVSFFVMIATNNFGKLPGEIICQIAEVLWFSSAKI